MTQVGRLNVKAHQGRPKKSLSVNLQEVRTLKIILFLKVKRRKSICRADLVFPLSLLCTYRLEGDRHFWNFWTCFWWKSRKVQTDKPPLCMLQTGSYNHADRFGIYDILGSMFFVKRSQGSQNYRRYPSESAGVKVREYSWSSGCLDFWKHFWKQGASSKSLK